MTYSRFVDSSTSLIICLVIVIGFSQCSAVHVTDTIYTTNVVDELNRLYDDYTVERGVEFAFCAYGTPRSITSITLPAQEGHPTRVSWQSCPMTSNYVGYGHSHPPDHPMAPLLSGTDINTFARQTSSKVSILVYKMGNELNIRTFHRPVVNHYAVTFE